MFGAAVLGAAALLVAQNHPETIAKPYTSWVEPGSGASLPREMLFENSLGRLGVLNATGPIDTKGPNGRTGSTTRGNRRVEIQTR